MHIGTLGLSPGRLREVIDLAHVIPERIFLWWSTTEWVAVGTFGLAAATLVLVWQTRNAVRAATRSADAAEEALALAHRPFVIPKDVNIQKNVGGHPEVDFSLRNVGAGPASSISVAVIVFDGEEWGTLEGERDLSVALGPSETYPGDRVTTGNSSAFVPQVRKDDGSSLPMDWSDFWQDKAERGALGLLVAYNDIGGRRYWTAFRSGDGAVFFDPNASRGRWVAPGSPGYRRADTAWPNGDAKGSPRT